MTRFEDGQYDSEVDIAFTEMVLVGDLRSVEIDKELRERRRRLKAHFARIADTEEQEEDEEA